MNSCWELILNAVIPLFIFLCFDQSISAWSSVGAFSFAVFMLLDEQSIVREVHPSYCSATIRQSASLCHCMSLHKPILLSDAFSWFSYFGKTAASGEMGGLKLLNLAKGWLNPSSDVRSTPSSLHHSVFTETYNTELWCIPSPVHSLSDGKHSPPGLTDPISDSIFMGMSECPIYAAYHLLHSISQSISLFKIGKK